MDIKDGYLSVIGTSLFFPLSIIYEQILELKDHKGNEVQVSPNENGYSVAGIVLSVLLLESFVSRINSILVSRKGINRFIKGVNLIKSEFGNDSLADRINEVYIIRDVIAHNHVWSADIISNETGLLFEGEPLKPSIFGDKKFKNSIDANSRTTRLLGLNIFPTKIGRKDAIAVLENVYNALIYFEGINRIYCYISHIPIQFKNEAMTFSDFVKTVCSPNTI